MKYTLSVLLTIVLLAPTPASAQVGKSLGVVDANTAAEADLAAMPYDDAGDRQGARGRSPVRQHHGAQRLPAGAEAHARAGGAFYAKAFVHINLNTATREEILLVPGAGNRMAREFAEYRPWKTWAQFDKEIGKYVGAQETARLAQYCFIPVNLNTATDDDILSIPGAGRRMVREFKEYRPWKTQAQFDKEIGKYVDAKEVKRLWRFVVIE